MYDFKQMFTQRYGANYELAASENASYQLAKLKNSKQETDTYLDELQDHLSAVLTKLSMRKHG
jgi:hypothetical protein